VVGHIERLVDPRRVLAAVVPRLVLADVVGVIVLVLGLLGPSVLIPGEVRSSAAPSLSGVASAGSDRSASSRNDWASDADAALFELSPSQLLGRLSEGDVATQLARIEAAADAIVPFAWRERVGDISIACRSTGAFECPLGVAVADGSLVFAPSVALIGDSALQAVVAHEFAHVWQFSRSAQYRAGSSLLPLITQPLPGLPVGIPLKELEADCLAVSWGAEPSLSEQFGYWRCPPAALALVARTWREVGS
jgi:hypothetical protein